jgi:gamma-glutamyltranspeptidase/glutathione hydrolase
VEVYLEDGISAAAADELRAKGHTVFAAHTHPAEVAGAARRRFGKGQIIQARWQEAKSGGPRAVLWAGSDPRGDGCAMGW